MILDVLLGEVRVGAITLRPDGRSVFRFDESYLRLPERPTLGRWFEDRLKPSFEYSASGGQLPAFFQNYLPEMGSALRALVARHADVESHAEVPLLAALGGDLPGAIVVRASNAGVAVPGAGEAVAAQTASTERPLRFSLVQDPLSSSRVQARACS